MSDDSDDKRKRKKSRKNRDWDEEEDGSEDDEQAIEPSKNALDVQIKTKGFTNKVESDAYRRFKKRSNKNFEVEEISLDQLCKLEHTNQIGGGGKNKKKKIEKKSKTRVDDDSEEEKTKKKRKSGTASKRPFTPELETPRLSHQNTAPTREYSNYPIVDLQNSYSKR